MPEGTDAASGDACRHRRCRVALLDAGGARRRGRRGPKALRRRRAATSTRWPRSSPAHLGDRAPVLAGPPRDRRAARRPRADAGKRVNAARSAVQDGVRRRAAPCSRPSATSGCWSRSASTSPCPCDRQPARRPAPDHHARRSGSRDLFVGDGLRGRRGPRARVGVAQLRRAQHRAGPPGPHHAGHVLLVRRPAPTTVRAGAAHAHLAGAGPHACSTRQPPIYVVCPGRVYRTDELDATHTPGLPPGRGPGRRQGHHDGAPARARWTTSPGRMFGADVADPLRPSYFPFTEPSAEFDVWFPEHRGRRRLGRVGRLRHGQPERAARLRHRPGGVLRLRVRHGHRAHAACSATASATCATWSRATSGSAAPSASEVRCKPEDAETCVFPCPGCASTSTGLPDRPPTRSATAFVRVGLEVEDVAPRPPSSPGRWSSAGCSRSRS